MIGWLRDRAVVMVVTSVVVIRVLFYIINKTSTLRESFDDDKHQKCTHYSI